MALGVVVSWIIMFPMSAYAEELLNIPGADALLVTHQTLADNELDLGGHENAISLATDIGADASGTTGINAAAGDYNLQDNAAVLALIVDGTPGESQAKSSALQTLLGQSFNSDSAGLVTNAVSVDISARDGVSGAFGLNAAAGAFNIQMNGAIVTAVSGNVLAQSFAFMGQDAGRNISQYRDVSNEVTAAVHLDAVSGNVGINIASGVGNVQMNSATIARSF